MPNGSAKTIPSILSRIPPCPGNKSPVSLTFALRFNKEMNKSPSWHIKETTIARITKL